MIDPEDTHKDWLEARAREIQQEEDLNEAESQRYYCTLITLNVLSDSLIPVERDIALILEDCDSGPYVLGAVERREIELTKEEMERSLVGSGSDEEFFNYGLGDGGPLDTERGKHEVGEG